MNELSNPLDSKPQNVIAEYSNSDQEDSIDDLDKSYQSTTNSNEKSANSSFSNNNENSKSVDTTSSSASKLQTSNKIKISDIDMGLRPPVLAEDQSDFVKTTDEDHQ